MSRRAFSTALAIVLFAAALVVWATGAHGATSVKKWYWPQSRAEAYVVAKVRLPFCRVLPDDSYCDNGVPLPGTHPIGFTLGSARCTGADELRRTFKFSRFDCAVVSSYAPYFTADVAVYVTGASTFRWKLL